MSRLLVVLALVSGCSVALQAKPPKTGSVAASGCTTSSTYWIADGVGVGVGAAAAIGGTALALANRDGNEEVGWMIAGAGAMTAVLYYASADSGRDWARECAASSSVASR
jgi:hypothetical protein